MPPSPAPPPSEDCSGARVSHPAVCHRSVNAVFLCNRGMRSTVLKYFFIILIYLGFCHDRWMGWKTSLRVHQSPSRRINQLRIARSVIPRLRWRAGGACSCSLFAPHPQGRGTGAWHLWGAGTGREVRPGSRLLPLACGCPTASLIAGGSLQGAPYPRVLPTCLNVFNEGLSLCFLMEMRSFKLHVHCWDLVLAGAGMLSPSFWATDIDRFGFPSWQCWNSAFSASSCLWSLVERGWLSSWSAFSSKLSQKICNNPAHTQLCQISSNLLEYFHQIYVTFPCNFGGNKYIVTFCCKDLSQNLLPLFL